MRSDITKKLPCLALLFSLFPLLAAHSFPANSWSHLESMHFVVSYNERTAHLSTAAATTAEEVYGALADWFGYPRGEGKISIVLLDQSDDPNGFTASRDPLVSVDCRKAQSLFRGETDWLRTVLSHELSHVFSLRILNPPMVVGTAVGVSSTTENFDAHGLHYWGVNEVPEWFIEGVAQIGSYQFKADFRDPIREMVLRDAVRGGTLLTLEEMARFEGTSLDYELVYNQGFSFILFLEKTYGAVSLKALCAAAREKGLYEALGASYGKKPEALYQDWKDALVARYAGVETWTTGRRAFERADRMGVEVGSVGDGGFVMANWGNDYARFGLFRKGSDGRYSEVYRYTGLVLKADRSTGDAWFNASAYNHATGVDNYDIFRCGPDGRVTRVTDGARCLAFDVREGRLVYARYRDGKTEIVQRKPDGAESVLSEVFPGFEVYGLSLASADTALLAMGTGNAVHLGILADGRMTYLWKDQEILDAADAGDNRIVFTSTRSGSPQVYWADLQEDPGRWFQVTGAAGGARFPAVSGEPGSERLSFSVFEGGSYHLYSLDDPFTRDHPVEVGQDTVEEPSPAGPPLPAEQPVRAWANPVFAAPTFYSQFYAVRYNNNGATATVPYVAIGASGSIFNAPQNLGLDASATVFSYLYPGTPFTPDFSGVLAFSFDLWQLQNVLQYALQTTTQYSSVYTFTLIYNELNAQTQYQLSSHHAVRASVDFAWLGDKQSFSDIFFAALTEGVRWRYTDSPSSRFDPANLGQPLVSAYAGGDARYQEFPTFGYSDISWYVDPQWSFMPVGGVELRALLLGSRLSCDLQLDGLYLLDTPSALPTPYLQPYIGGETSFSGYPAQYAQVNSMARVAFEIRANPLVDTSGKTEWYQRLSFGAKVEAGVVQYYSSGLALGFPLSLEASLRQYFYGAPNRESIVYIKVGVPLIDFMGTIALPLQLYGGYSY